MTRKKSWFFLICFAVSLSASAAVDGIAAPLSYSTDQKHAARNIRVTQILMEARWNYWQGYPLRAIRYYRYLLRIAPENQLAGLYGELGNVYYQMEAYYAAGVAYSHSAWILIHEKKVQGARNLLPMITRTDPVEAHKLRIQLNNQETPYRDRTPTFGYSIPISASYCRPFGPPAQTDCLCSPRRLSGASGL